MHNFVLNLRGVCGETFVLFTNAISQHILCVECSGFCAVFPNIFHNFYTFIFNKFSLLYVAFSHHTHALLLELQLYKLLIEGF